MKKVLISFILILFSSFFFNAFNEIPVKAALDAEARSHGFSVDRNEWYPSKWTSKVIPVYRENYKVGEAVVNIGKATCKQKTSDKKFINTIMIDIKMRGNNYKKNWYGYASDIYVSSKLPKGEKLLSASPVNSPSSKSITYSVGVEFSSEKKANLGISGSTTIVKKSMKITDDSNYGSNQYATIFHYNRGINANYRYNTNSQIACFETKTNNYHSVYEIDATIGFAVGKKGILGNSKRIADDIPTFSKVKVKSAK